MPDDGASDTSHARLENRASPVLDAVAHENTKDAPSAISRTSDEHDSSSIAAETSSATSKKHGGLMLSHESRPPLPPRPSNLALLRDNKANAPSTTQDEAPLSRPNLQSLATTAVSRTDIQTQSFQDGSRETFAASADSTPARKPYSTLGSARKMKTISGSETGDTSSIRSFAPTLSRGGDNESLLGDVFGSAQDIPTWKLFSGEDGIPESFDVYQHEETFVGADFYREFDAVESADDVGQDEEQLLKKWKSKRKQFMILSSAGKPIYSRHGDDNLISSTIGIIHTIISFYEDSNDKLTGFTAGGARFVIMSQGPLYLVAISKLGENDAQLRAQLEALYMQILSTLTLPTLNHLFANRPSTDLRRPLKGTEVLLSTLADTFTRGSSSALLSSLECLKMNKNDRSVINETLLRHRCHSLLYGLVVAGGRLVSVARPRKHSLHPSDLQLIFNMLFEADGIKEGGGENWIPICLPGFNKNGYLYMYVSFVSTSQETVNEVEDVSDPQDTVVVLLISANKESFYELRDMRSIVVDELEKNGSMEVVRTALRNGRPSTTDMIPGTVLRHFLYKSKANVQFVMPSYEPEYGTLLARRKLLSLYHTLHANVHAKNAHLKVQHCISLQSISLAWVTPIFELYCVAGPNVSRTALAQGANKIIQWIRREEERIFIIGGAVF